MRYIGILVVSLLVIMLQFIYNGLVFSWLWEWFIVKQFSLNPISVTEAASLCFIVAYVTHQIDTKTDDKDFHEVWLQAAVFGFLKPTVAIVIGFIVSFAV